MKKSNNHWLVTLLLVFLFTHKGHTQEQKTQDFYGIWQVDTELQLSRTMTESRSSFEPLDDFQKKSFEETLKSRVYIFYEDGRFESAWVASGSLRTVHGQWSLDRDNAIEIILEDDAKYVYNYQLTGRHLVLTPPAKAGGLMQTLQLKRTGQ